MSPETFSRVDRILAVYQRQFELQLRKATTVRERLSLERPTRSHIVRLAMESGLNSIEGRVFRSAKTSKTTKGK